MALKLNSSGGGSVTIQEPVTSSNYTLNVPGTVTTLTDAATITPDFAANNVFTVTLGGNRTIANPSTPIPGQSGSIFIVQDGTGSRTVTWPSSVKWPASTAPTITSTASKGDKFVFVGDGTYWWASSAGQNYL